MPTVAPFGQIVEAAVLARHERIAGRPARRHGDEFETRLGDRGKVFQAVDGDIGAVFVQGGLDRLREDAEAAHRGQGRGLVAVAVRLDEDEFDRRGATTGRSFAATKLACHRASGLPRVPSRSAEFMTSPPRCAA